ncbi:MAG: hypothetical protein H7Z42_08520 [Roseiflexaceae bacterium]|nr:hypothetical protein [Roseiflexaceae bacterium]
MISPATPGDLWTLRRKPRSQVMLYNEAMLAKPHRFFWCALRSMTAGSSYDGATLMHRERSVRAAVQSLGRSSRAEHDIVMLATYGGERGYPTDPDLWFRLLEHLIFRAGRASVQRLYAALSQRHGELREIFRQLGFVHYTTQSVLRLEGPDWDQGTSLAPLRPQTRRSLFAIQKLYGLTTPKPVQQAEVRESRSWKLPRRRLSRPNAHGWVLGTDDTLSTYLHVTSGPAGHVFSLLLHPEVRDLTPDVIRFGLAQIRDDLPVYLLLREYQRELLLPASDLGFQPIGEQALYVKHTTAPVRQTILRPAIETIVETRLPIPTISSINENARAYVKSTGYHEQHRAAAGDAAVGHPDGA